MNWIRLRELMMEYEGGISGIARELNIKRHTLYKGLERKDLNIVRLEEICKILGVSPRIFFNKHLKP